MKYDFDQIIERRGTDSNKWQRYGDDVIPLWVADMDFISADPILQALHQRIDHGIFGYTRPTQELRTVIWERLKRLYEWEIKEEDLVFLPGLVTGLNLAYHAFSHLGDEVLVQPPVYFHFVHDPVMHGRALVDPPLVQRGDSYEIDFDEFEKAVNRRTKVFLFCNPHNPVGRVYTRKELERVAEICLRHDVIICSDEIHCDLLFPGYRHLPIAALNPEVANQTVTLMAPSKTFNLAGLHCGYAVIQNPRLRKIWETFSHGLIPGVNIMGHVAALAGYQDGQEWLDQVLLYLKDNRDFLDKLLKEKIPHIRMTKMEATYLAWLDCRDARVLGNPSDFFLRKARVALNDGSEFGKGGEGFVRLNFACPRKTLTEALDRMVLALKRL
ncbi:MAG TPA: PatB family C-S lyase [Thermodesulfobacteriota bacterium]|nr:PatB family C-S lyase [Thermodesulfobacteriota bacterium]